MISINQKYQLHIVTIEDDRIHVHGRAARSTSANWASTRTTSPRCARVAPDVILMGEMRDTGDDPIRDHSLETGHLVFSALHTNDAKQSLDRILDSFEGPEAKQVRLQPGCCCAASVSA
jgi:twitching motility protein PilT